MANKWGGARHRHARSDGARGSHINYKLHHRKLSQRTAEANTIDEHETSVKYERNLQYKSDIFT
jgi:hypothetical protein